MPDRFAKRTGRNRCRVSWGSVGCNRAGKIDGATADEWLSAWIDENGYYVVSYDLGISMTGLLGVSKRPMPLGRLPLHLPF